MMEMQIAHLNERGNFFVIVPVESSFGAQSRVAQEAAIDRMRLAAMAAHLNGTVVPVWQHGDRLAFRAPQRFHSFFRSLSLPIIRSKLNATLPCQ
ncbi:hypothetical protein [Bosea sp. TAF32]|uniref:hypothetical protein n=1 Tax=Bosea sp. TAF32 TaxID=3237482 RepID=UPI003F93821D